MSPDPQEVLLPGGIELAEEAAAHLHLSPDTRFLSVGCGTGELEVYFAARHGCCVTGVDSRREFIERATAKARARQVEGLASFEVGDGGALRFPDGSFDAVFCSGALCAFYEAGLGEFHRVLAPGGACAISDILWRHDDVPGQVVQRWTQGAAHVSTVEGHCAAFERHGFRVRHARAYHEPSWWKAFYAARSASPHWMAERDRYRQDRQHFALGLFILDKA